MTGMVRAKAAPLPPEINTAAAEGIAATEAQRVAQRRVKTSIVGDAITDTAKTVKKQLFGG